MKSPNPDALLRAYVARFPTTQAAANALGVTWQNLHDVLKGKYRPSDKMLAKLGLERVIVQRKAS